MRARTDMPLDLTHSPQSMVPSDVYAVYSVMCALSKRRLQEFGSFSEVKQRILIVLPRMMRNALAKKL